VWHASHKPISGVACESFADILNALHSRRFFQCLVSPYINLLESSSVFQYFQQLHHLSLFLLGLHLKVPQPRSVPRFMVMTSHEVAIIKELTMQIFL